MSKEREIPVIMFDLEISNAAREKVLNPDSDIDYVTVANKAVAEIMASLEAEIEKEVSNKE